MGFSEDKVSGLWRKKHSMFKGSETQNAGTWYIQATLRVSPQHLEPSSEVHVDSSNISQ